MGQRLVNVLLATAGKEPAKRKSLGAVNTCKHADKSLAVPPVVKLVDRVSLSKE